MTEKRFDFKYDGVGHSYYLCDKEEGASYEDRVFAEIWADKSEVEDIVNKMNALHEENQTLLHIIDWCLTHHREVGHIVFDSRDEFFIWLKEKGVLE